MDIQNSIEIITEFISRSSFTKIYSDRNLPFSISTELSMLEPEQAVDYLVSSSQVGGRVIGFFKELPNICVKNSLRGDCIFIVVGLPKQVDVPTLFCKNLDEFTLFTSVAFKLSSDIKLPIVISLSDNVLNNYAISKKYDSNTNRLQNYISKELGVETLTSKDFNEKYNIAKQILRDYFPNDDIRYSELGFNYTDKPFFKYIIPDNMHFSLERSLTVYEDEVEPISSLMQSLGKGRLDFHTVKHDEYVAHFEYLCAGCPIVTIMSSFKDIEEYRFFTDVRCEGIHNKFNLTQVSLDTYLGMLGPNLNVKPVMISYASSYRPYQSKLIKYGSVILLNNTGIKSIDGFNSLKHPQRFSANKNILFPYSCYNIRGFGWAKINKKKCNCAEVLLDTPPCIDKTSCCAISMVDDKAKVDSFGCSGCMACAKFCPQKAIR